MVWDPAEIALCFLAAQALVERVASRPFAEFSRDRVGRDDQRRLAPCSEAPCEGARDAADGKPFDCGTDIAGSRWGAFERQRVEIREILAVHQRPSHGFAFHHAYGLTFDRLAGKAMEDAALRLVDHRRMDDDAID